MFRIRLVNTRFFSYGGWKFALWLMFLRLHVEESARQTANIHCVRITFYVARIDALLKNDFCWIHELITFANFCFDSLISLLFFWFSSSRTECAHSRSTFTLINCIFSGGKFSISTWKSLQQKHKTSDNQMSSIAKTIWTSYLGWKKKWWLIFHLKVKRSCTIYSRQGKEEKKKRVHN